MNLTSESIVESVQTQLIKDLIESPDFVDSMIEYLSNHTIVVEFQKTDGDTRRMRCTRDLKMIPESMHPKSNSTTRKSNSIPAFDLDKMEWRSFVPERIVKLDLNTPSHNSIH